ncbi:MAG: hypothetical protein K6E27_07820 [Eubacterium sp.]|nr:hypothetical protein [Eubacterium sp.]
MRNFFGDKRNIALLSVAVATAVLCILLPKNLISYKKRAFTNVCMDVPEEYYPTSSYYEVTKEFSEKLSEYQRRQLISGQWASEISEVDKEYFSDTGYHVQEKAKDLISNLNEGGFYPASIDSSYQQWYNWKCTYYQALDMNFKTYAGFFWKTNFLYYEGGEQMTAYTTPDGRLIKVIYTIDDESKSTTQSVGDLKEKYKPYKDKVFSMEESGDIVKLMFGDDFEVTTIEIANNDDIETVRQYIKGDKLTSTLGVEDAGESSEVENNAGSDEYDISVTVVTVLDYSAESSDTEGNDYYLYVYQSENEYAIGLIPTE